ncbi:MAG: histidine--tRNA ligase [Oscillospiraceae bacterium]|nr:histidine--tRNA ligase [Oscillospiraceae bacterium]
MELLTRAPRGTADVLPGDSYKWQYAERIMAEVAAACGYREMRMPVFEHTELFQRSVGETTDVVQKEMYTFLDKGGRSVTLRPEGTAGAARAFLEHALHNETLPVKAYYLTSCYRYEKPQAGRLREFHQFGIECFGAAAPQADAEVIALANAVIGRLEIAGVTLRINSIGCPDCRAAYHAALRGFLDPRRDSFCETCRGRLERNPMRVLDCKIPSCGQLTAGAPRMMAHLCDGCRAHFDAVCGYLEAAGIAYSIDPGIVRGLDYYTRTVFEFVSDLPIAQPVVVGGGRYDGLMQELGGPLVPSLGFGMGIERILLAMEASGAKFPDPPAPELYLAAMGEDALRACFAMAVTLREKGLRVECDTAGRGLKAQMKYADKIGARYVMVVGGDELAAGKAKLKEMASGEEREVVLDGGIIRELRN